MFRCSCSSLAVLLIFVAPLLFEISQAVSVDNAAVVNFPGGGENFLRPEQCGGACEHRCSKTSHKKPCVFFCNKCCVKCLCVPSGTFGHKEECPCYNNWKTKEGRPKCP